MLSGTPSEADEGGDQREGPEAEEPNEDDGVQLRFGIWQSAFQPYLSEWRENLWMPQWEPREGVLVFRASWGRDVWRRIAAPAESSLDDLAFTTEMDEGPLTDELDVGQWPLEHGQPMLLIYDFGDEWGFEVTLERVDPPIPAMKAPRILERHGRAPKQFDREWD
jgi:hypothetical protein